MSRPFASPVAGPHLQRESSAGGQNKIDSVWSTIIETEVLREKLQLLCHSPGELKKEGYVLEPLSAAKIQTKLRCLKCGARVKRVQRGPRPLLTGAGAGAGVDHKENNGVRKPKVDDNDLIHFDEAEKKEVEEEEVDCVSKQVEATTRTATATATATTTTATITTEKPRIHPGPHPVCAYHTGRVFSKVFTCCGKPVSQPGCTTDLVHTFPPANDPYVHQHWQYHHTPFTVSGPVVKPQQTLTQPRRHGRTQTQAQWESNNQTRIRPSLNAPKQRHGSSTHTNPPNTTLTYNPGIGYTERPYSDPVSAVALDCEMGTSSTNDTELIRLTAIDFFTGRVLIDSLVQPSVGMKHYNTRYSGVTAADMRHAVRTRTCIFGRDRARKMLWRYVGPETIVVVHGGQNDFQALRWIHPWVIDTCLLQTYIGEKTEGGRSLQNLCKVVLGIAVQQGGRRKSCYISDASSNLPLSEVGKGKGKGSGVGVGVGDESASGVRARPGPGPGTGPGKQTGHDSWEDAMACRELAIYWIDSIPDN